MRNAVFIASIAAGFAALTGGPARATTMFEQDFTCPIGGEEFSSYSIGSYSSFGQRPDGRSYGTLPIFPLTECPGNGFLLIQDEYTEGELALLGETVASAEYQAMRTGETSYYRAWWLLGKIGADPYRLASVLLRASWEADSRPELKARYQAAFVNAALALDPAAGADSEWFWLNLRAANILREQGRFDEAQALLATLDRPGTLPNDPDELEGARYLIDGLKELAAEANPFNEPTNLIPAREASFRCVIDRDALTGAEARACADTEILNEIADTEIDTDDGRELAGEAAIRYIAETYRN